MDLMEFSFSSRRSSQATRNVANAWSSRSSSTYTPANCSQYEALSGQSSIMRRSVRAVPAYRSSSKFAAVSSWNQDSRGRSVAATARSAYGIASA